MATLLILSFVFALLGYLFRDYLRNMIGRATGKLPPGPPALPVIGTLGLNDDAPWESMTKWADQYGKIFTFFLGPQMQVVLADGDLVRAVLKDPRLDGRPETNLSRIFKNNALAFSEGSKWKDTRRFEIATLKDFGRGGSGSNLLEEYVQESANQLVQEVAASNGATFYTKDCMQTCVANCIASVLCGHSLKSDDPRFARITDNVSVILGSATTPSSVLNVFPWLKIIPPFSQRQALLEERMDETVHFIRQVIAEHRKNFDPDNVQDFIDAYLLEQSKAVAPESFTDDQLVYMGVEMYAAGLDGTLAALQWWTLLIASHPDIQKRSQDEIDANIGTEKLVSWSDRSQLPYNEAILNEVLRIAVVDPFGLPHRFTDEMSVQGFTIPKDTAVIVNYYGIHFSPESFPDPVAFRPERFLENGKIASNINSFPFATGRRMCSGDNFAKTIVFIAMVSLMQRFTFRRVNAVPWTQIKRINAVGVHPDKFYVTASAR